jgi:TetR/AcrR family transcriptional repressor of lmrAB and yxaGH operons
MGRTSAWSGEVIVGSGASRQAYFPASSTTKCFICGLLNDLSSIVKSVPRPDRSRAALIDTAGTLFRRQGYAATGLNQILDDAGVKAGSLYHHFPGGKQELAAAVVESAGAAIERILRLALAQDVPVGTVVDRWVDLLVAGLAADGRDGCPVEPIATESVHASELVRHAAARAFDSWCTAISQRLRAEGWGEESAGETALAVISVIEGALMLSRTSGDAAALNSARLAVYAVLSQSREPADG